MQDTDTTEPVDETTRLRQTVAHLSRALVLVLRRQGRLRFPYQRWESVRGTERLRFRYDDEAGIMVVELSEETSA